MLLPEEDTEVFKQWVLPKLETISDADAEVLADYVVALVTTEDEDANIRRNCIDSLSDFLQDNTAPFVDQVIRTLKNKSYAPRSSTKARTEAPAPIPSIVGTSTSEYLPNTALAFNAAPLHAPKGPAASRTSDSQHRLSDRPTGPSPGAQQEQNQRSRKRKQNDRDTSQSHEHTGNGRPVKQPARSGGRSGRGGSLNAQAPAFAPMPTLPQFNPGLGEIPPFDPTNPMSFLAMAAAFGVNLPGMPQLPVQGGGSSRERCADYDNKGFCALGSLCPYKHELEYDPDQPDQGMHEGSRYSADRGYNGRPLGGRARAPFSLPGPTRNRSNTTLVVEQIPEDYFSEEHVREFFGKFGTILDIRMQAYKRLAVVKYETHEAASAAYTSPKVIFDNRFVKVYWHRSNADLGPQRHYNGFDEEEESYGDDYEMPDPEEIERRQAEAQRAFEERRKKEEEAAAKAEELDRKLQETNAEILRVRRELARVSGSAAGNEEDMSQDLATLQAEAETLFAQQDAAADSWRGASRGQTRGGYRGRGYAPRGRNSRGSSYRGRGPFHGAVRTGVKRLDNRPRRIAIKDVQPGSTKDEALRQHLFNIPDLLSTTTHPETPHSLVLTFAERYQAEAFVDAAHAIPDVGVLDMEWVGNDVGGGGGGGGVQGVGDKEEEEKEEEEGEGEEGEKGEGFEAGDGKVDRVDEDMDVAEDEDQWL